MSFEGKKKTFSYMGAAALSLALLSTDSRRELGSYLLEDRALAEAQYQACPRFWSMFIKPDNRVLQARITETSQRAGDDFERFKAETKYCTVGQMNFRPPVFTMPTYSKPIKKGTTEEA